MLAYDLCVASKTRKRGTGLLLKMTLYYHLQVLMAKRELREEIRQLEARHAALAAETAQMKGSTLALTRHLSSGGPKAPRRYVSAFPAPLTAVD